MIIVTDMSQDVVDSFRRDHMSPLGDRWRTLSLFQLLGHQVRSSLIRLSSSIFETPPRPLNLLDSFEIERHRHDQPRGVYGSKTIMSTLSLYLLTFNCGRTLVQPESFAPYLFNALPLPQTLPEILVISLEEIAPIGYSFLGGSFLTPYFNAFRQTVKLASKDTIYVNAISRNVGMTAIMVFVRKDLLSRVSTLRTAGVGVGVQEMGNKGAVGVRLDFQTHEDADEVMQLTFVAAHLAAMEDGLKERNENWRSIVQGLAFVSDDSNKPYGRDEQEEDVPLLQGMPGGSSQTSGIYTPESYLFLSGDLNYRTSETKPTPDDVRRFPQPTTSTEDPKHFSHLFARDQLTQQLQANESLHGLIEAPMTFPPTYKYANDPSVPLQDDDVQEWKWAHHRWPSWCDRILYLDLPPWMSPNSAMSQIEVHNYKALPLFPTSDHRPVALSLTIPLLAIPAPDGARDDIRMQPPFSIDPQWKSRRDFARKKEIVVGILAYLSLTWEGNGLLLATVIGGIGGWLIISSMLD